MRSLLLVQKCTGCPIADGCDRSNKAADGSSVCRLEIGDLRTRETEFDIHQSLKSVALERENEIA